jgi:hypothetical protein
MDEGQLENHIASKRIGAAMKEVQTAKKPVSEHRDNFGFGGGDLEQLSTNGNERECHDLQT